MTGENNRTSPLAVAARLSIFLRLKTMRVWQFLTHEVWAARKLEIWLWRFPEPVEKMENCSSATATAANRNIRVNLVAIWRSESRLSPVHQI
jgi:hypothetical protein